MQWLVSELQFRGRTAREKHDLTRTAGRSRCSYTIDDTKVCHCCGRYTIVKLINSPIDHYKYGRCNLLVRPIDYIVDTALSNMFCQRVTIVTISGFLMLNANNSIVNAVD